MIRSTLYWILSNDQKQNVTGAVTGGVIKKGVLKTFAKLLEKHLFQCLVFNKVVGLSLTLY